MPGPVIRLHWSHHDSEAQVVPVTALRLGPGPGRTSRSRTLAQEHTGTSLAATGRESCDAAFDSPDRRPSSPGSPGRRRHQVGWHPRPAAGGQPVGAAARAPPSGPLGALGARCRVSESPATAQHRSVRSAGNHRMAPDSDWNYNASDPQPRWRS